jgi:hypothetical protein
VQWLKPIIIAFQEAEIRRITIQGQPNKNVHKTPSRPIAGLQDVATVETVATVTPATVETKNRKTVVQADLGKK